MQEELQESEFKDLFPEDAKQYSNGEPSKTTGSKRTRKPRGTTGKVATISRDAVKSALELANLGLALTAHEYALVPEEIDALTEAWYQVIKDYPSVGKYLVVGKKLGMWGNLAFVHYQIVMRRYNIVTADRDKTRTTRPTSRHDGQRQDNTSGTAAVVS
jgi:hypothetical protein